jgi:hypothetical protein
MCRMKTARHGLKEQRKHGVIHISTERIIHLCKASPNQHKMAGPLGCWIETIQIGQRVVVVVGSGSEPSFGNC